MKFGRIYKSLVTASVVSLMLLIGRTVIFQDLEFWYLAWNLILAWIPFLLSVALVNSLKKNSWLTWQNTLITFLWLIFLPNAFYIGTDLVHLQNAIGTTLLFDIVLILSFTLNGLILGYISVFMLHLQLIKRVKKEYAHYTIGLIFLLCGFAIYLGRYLRWNTWDILINPAGLLFDVSDRFINPLSYEQTYWTTILFFIMLSTFYYVIWQAYHEFNDQFKNKSK